MSLESVLEATETKAATPAVSPAATPAEPVKTPAEEPKPGTVAPVEGQPVVQAEPQVEEEPNLEEAPESSGDFSKYKPLFKDNPELRNIIGREKAFSELGNFSDVREIVSRIPTIEDAEVLTEQAENAKTFGETFRGDRVSFVESLKESDPLAFQALATELPDILAQTDEKLYAEQARSYTNRVLSNTLAIAQQGGDAEFLKAVQIVAQYLGVQPGSASLRTVDNSEASRLRRQLAERDQSDANQAFESFWSATDEAIISTSITELESVVKKALPNATQKQLEKINKEVWQKTLATLNAQPQFRQQIESYKAAAQKGRVGVADHKQIVDFGTRRAKLVIPKVAREVISEWSNEVLQLSSDTNGKRQQIAERTKDVGTGPQGTTSAAAASAGNGAKLRSMNSIFEQIENRTYVKK